MSQRARITRLERSLSARESVLLWVEEVQRYPSADDYVRAALDQPTRTAPLDRILDRVAAAIGAALKGKDPPGVQRAMQRELRDAVFLYALVLELNAAAADGAARCSSLALAISAQLRNLAADLRSQVERRARPIPRGPPMWTGGGRPGAPTPRPWSMSCGLPTRRELHSRSATSALAACCSPTQLRSLPRPKDWRIISASCLTHCRRRSERGPGGVAPRPPPRPHSFRTSSLRASPDSLTTRGSAPTGCWGSTIARSRSLSGDWARHRRRRPEPGPPIAEGSRAPPVIRRTRLVR